MHARRPGLGLPFHVPGQNLGAHNEHCGRLTTYNFERLSLNTSPQANMAERPNVSGDLIWEIVRKYICLGRCRNMSDHMQDTRTRTL